MSDAYLPQSPVLAAIVRRVVADSPGTLTADEAVVAAGFVNDAHLSNRDWAVFLLAASADRSPAVLAALVAAMDDPNEDVRAEAMCGVAERAPDRALGPVTSALATGRASLPLFEAAARIADAALVPFLAGYVDDAPTTDPVAIAARDALVICSGQRAANENAPVLG